jgi:hypothetical protein
VNVTVSDGGLKLIQIRDNGGGIHPDDLPILCHRHTTSKINTFEDLAAVNTLGFRGEALCSISFVSRLTVTTMQPGAELGYRVEYRDSKMLGTAPEPCASTPGTIIQVSPSTVLFRNSAFLHQVPVHRKPLTHKASLACLAHVYGTTVSKQHAAMLVLYTLVIVKSWGVH